MKRFLPLPLVAWLCAVVLAGCGGDSAPFASACVTAPDAVAAGADGSVYVEDKRGISHYASSGKLLFRVHPARDSSFASDRLGNLYYATGAGILEVSGTGAPLRRLPAPAYQPEAIDRQGNIVAVLGGSSGAQGSSTKVERLSPSGRLLSLWKSPYAAALAVAADGSLYGNGGLNAGGDLARLDPSSGKVLKLFYRAPGDSFNAVAVDPRGTVYVGATTGADAPFAVEKLSVHGARDTFSTLNSSQESVADLAVGSDGKIFVIRASYAEPGDGGGTGLEELSPSGSSDGKFAFC